MTTRPRKAKVTKKRMVIAYAEFWHTANCLIENGQQEPSGSAHQFRAALVFQAFTLEAALNHVGAHLFSCWHQIEKQLGPEKKIMLISEKIPLCPNFSSRPWQILGELMSYRNALAHGKTRVLEASYEEDVREYMDKKFFDFVPTDDRTHTFGPLAIRDRAGCWLLPRE